MGSYFGSSLCAVDLNMDGLSDLLVGAPMFSEIRDEGQVTVYLNKGNVSTVWVNEEMGIGRDNCPVTVTSPLDPAGSKLHIGPCYPEEMKTWVLNGKA